MNGLGTRGRPGPTVGVPSPPVHPARTRSSGRRSTADSHGGGRASRRDDTTSGHGGLDAYGKHRRRGTTYPRVQEAQVAERLDSQPRESQHPEPNQEQHTDRTTHKPQHPPPAARLINQDVRRKIAHASPNPVTVGSTRSRQGRNTGIRARQPQLADRAGTDRRCSSQRHGSTPMRSIVLASSLPAASRARTTKYSLACEGSPVFESSSRPGRVVQFGLEKASLRGVGAS